MWPFTKKQPQPEPFVVDFATDVAPLLFTVDHEINFVLAMHDVAAIRDEIVKEQFVRREMQAIVSKTIQRLAPSYKAVMRRYYTDEGLLEYLAQLCAMKLIAQGVQINMRHIGGTQTTDISGEATPEDTDE